MIEFALLFGLGFLSALLIVMLIAPAIHRRIVAFTENRIRATVPISPQEVRAQRDMARAVYAAENARTHQELQQERDKSLSLQLKGEDFKQSIKTLTATNIDLRTKLETLDVAAVELKSQLRREDGYIAELKSALETSEDLGVRKDLMIDKLRREIEVVAANHDNARIDLSTRETEIENLKFRISALREEREALRQDVKAQTTRAKEADNRLAQEEHRAMRLEDKLDREVAKRTDKETALERREEEIARLREKMKTRSPSAPETTETASKQQTAAAERQKESEPMPRPAPAAQPSETEIKARVDMLASDARNRATALSERLLNGKGTGNDAALREEMATIAAGMVAMTALSEGKASPVHAMVAGKPGNAKRQSLATRVKTLLGTTGDVTGRQP